MKTILAADLFCGAGGTTQGLEVACQDLGLMVDVLGINHWDRAIETFSRNHPRARTLCETLDSVNPRKAIPGGRLHLLVASPECIDHSPAKGGKPLNDQSRASAWHVPRWLDALKVESLIVENVPRFMKWGPLGAGGRPLKSRRGETFKAWLKAIESHGFRVEYKVLCAADYGDATTRERLFVMARKGRKHLEWPEPSRGQRNDSLFSDVLPWRPASAIIDWSIPSRSIYGRPKPLTGKTLARIAEGMRRFWGEPFVLAQAGGGVARSVLHPLPTITTDGAVRIIEPFVVTMRNHTAPRTIDDPITTISASGNHHLLVEAFIASYYGTTNVRRVSEPLPTITTKDRFALVVPQNPQKGEERMLHAFTRLQKLGRNFGVGSSYISQRPQEVNKKALNMAQTLFVFRTTGTQERAAIEKWIEDKALDEDIAGDLPKIATGHCHVWSPEFLKISETVHILEKETFNASATPEVGAAAVTRELAPIDLERVRTDMAATIEKAKADDPRELRKQIAELKKQVESTLDSHRIPPSQTVEKQVLTDADRALMAKLADGIGNIKEFLVGGHAGLIGEARTRLEVLLNAFLDDSKTDIESMRVNFEKRLESKGFQKILDKLAAVQPPPHNPPTTSAARPNPHGRRPLPAAAARPASVVPSSGEVGNTGLRRMLIALAQRNGLSARQLAVRTAMAVSGGSFRTYLSQGRTNGWIAGSGARIEITSAGLAALGSYDPLPEGEALQAYWLQELGNTGAASMLRALCAVYPKRMTKDVLGVATNMAPDGGSFRTYLSRLRTLELITGSSELLASEELFS